MWVPYLPARGRHLLAGPSSRSQLCPCHAKRYIPKQKQRKGEADGPSRQGGLRTRPTTTERSHGAADAVELLRELNNGGGGLLRDEEEADWGLDDIAEHARARAQHEQQRWGSTEARAGSATSTASGGARRRRRGAPELETHGSPLETGLASLSEGGGADAGAAPTAAVAASAVVPHSSGAASAGSRAGVPAVRQGSRAVELEASYARRNPEVVEALRLQGVAVRVRQPDAQYDHDNDGETEGGGKTARGAGRHRDELGYEDEEDDLRLSLATDLSAEEDPGARGHGSGNGQKAAGAPAGTDWYGSLAASGFSIRTNEAGEVFLERTVRRKAVATAAAATAGSSTSVPRGAGVAVGAAVTGGTGGAAAGAASAAHARTSAVGAASVSGQASNGGAGSSAGASAAAAAPALAPEPFVGTPAMAAALEHLTTPQQVLDFLELSYPQWAVNGYRLVDVRSGRPVPVPSPAEAAHCLRALALTALREEIGGWRCLDLAAGQQAQGLAECLRVTPPRLLPEIATQQLSAAYFEAARQYWLDPAVQPVIDDPGATAAKQVRLAAAKAAAAAAPQRGAALAPPYGTGDGGAAAVDLDDGEVLLEVRSGPLNDPVYDNLLSKYDTLSRHRQLLDAAQEARRQQPVLNGRATAGTTAAAAAAVAAGVAAARDQQGNPSAPPRPAGAAAAAEAKARVGASGEGPVPAATLPSAASAAADVWELRAAKVECLVAALWGMSSLGSTPYFMAETEAALSILVRCLATSRGAETRAATAPGGPSSSAPASASGSKASSSGRETSPGRPTGLSGWQAGQVLWAMGNSRHATPRLRDLEAVLLRAGGLAAMQPRDVSRVLWGFASLGHRPERLLLTIRPDWEWQPPGAAARRGGGGGGGGGKAAGGRISDVRSFSPQQLAGVVWALAVMQQVDTLPFRSAWGELLRRAKEVPPAEPVLTQIWQVNLALHLESSAGTATSSTTAAAAGTATTGAALPYNRSGGSASAVKNVDLTATGLVAAAAAVSASRGGAAAGARFDREAARGLLLRARDVFLAATSGLRRRVQSSYQRQMANTLTGLRVMHLVEDNSVGYSIDITLPQLRIAIEADGPTHTSRTPGGAVLGATMMKRRHLQLLGWHVINVPYKEWDKLSSETSRRAFLQERINAALLDRINLQEEESTGAGYGVGEKKGPAETHTQESAEG